MTFPWATTVKLVAFALCSVFVLTIMWNTLRNETGGTQVGYRGVFADASGLRAGDSVRVAGVAVGKVTAIALQEDNRAMVDFQVDQRHAIGTDTRVLIRYENLIGQRYLALRGGDKPGERLAPGATVPPSRTESALDLSVLMNGFEPLFQTLSPEDLNQVADTIIKVLQGEGATLKDLFTQVGTLAGDLATHDKVIGRLIENLAEVVTNLAARDAQFTDLVQQTRSLVDALAGDRRVIGRSLAGMDDLASTMTGLLRDIRPALRRDLAKADRVLGIYARDRAAVAEVLDVADEFFSLPVGPFQNGSWVDLYACKLEVNVVGLESLLTDLLLGDSYSGVCQ